MGPKSVVVGLVWNLANIFGGSRRRSQTSCVVRGQQLTSGISGGQFALEMCATWQAIKLWTGTVSQCVRAMSPCPRVAWGGRWAVALLRWGTLNSGAKAINLWQIFKRNGRTACGFAFALKSLSLALPPPGIPPGSALLSLRDVAALNTTHHFNYLFGHKKVETGGGGGQPFWPLCLLLAVFGTVFARRCCCCSAYAENR